ncbi:class I mannose-6-phosphate isomerase [Mucilaginibacter sp. X5P1]|uniref:class I mannose-6-phosphate isomerase n=1 Tax=Mucilaginibacter sp. X5P1 TaxID=2723088 RepID=UPI0017B7C14E|nr:class I mannose-6-phosphate isomerase [Mucilaginibacter sp. X5P1]MBB6140915.1 mannose-6-phosphate isomerase class I [Mucilaginibacter sp. X5P1]
MNSNNTTDQGNNYMSKGVPLRKSSQTLMPVILNQDDTEKAYNIYPVCSLGSKKNFNGYNSLVQWIIKQKTIVIDGYGGVFWDEIKWAIDQQITNAGLTINWIETAAYLKPVAEIDAMVTPFLGEKESVWGTKCLLTLKDFYQDEFGAQSPDKAFDINIVVGTGAALINWNAPVIYIDLPKNELQYRMRAGSITNLGSNQLSEPFLMYKRFYFVDWVLLNQHKKAILDKITVIADGQWIDDINWMFRSDFIEGLNKLSSSIIRVRPWFEPGVWGGQWIKQHIPKVNEDVENYAWSFELIVPENGLVFESDGYLLEVSFDFLMFHNKDQVLGKHAAQFGDEFPIRFDFLDTYDGANLSIQCHPRLKYIQEVFGENITQDETYYILDCKDDAQVFLGFQEDIDAALFKNALIESQNKNVEINITDFVQSLPAKKHDLFLIPNGTIHSAGANNMVLEISATPYIFTFKMYDWLRLDMDGNPRPINIDHAFNNLNFERKGGHVSRELISKPRIIEAGEDWQLVHLPTHQEHFYDVHRIEFDKEINIETNNDCHVMMLVEGESVFVETADGAKQAFAYAETFVIPAAAKNYKLTNLGKGRAKVIKAFLK